MPDKKAVMDTEHMPKILIFHPALTPYRVGIFNALNDMFQTAIVLLTTNNANQKFDQKKLLADLALTPEYLANVSTIFGRNTLFGINKTINNHKPDVVITSEFSVVTWLTAILKLGKRDFVHIIWTDDNISLIESDRIHRRLARKVFKYWADGWLFISAEVQAYYRETVGINQPSALIPVIHDERAFRGKLLNTDQVRRDYVEKYNLEGKHVLLFVGRLVEVKALDTLIEAFKTVAENLPDSVLVLVGEGSEYASLKRLSVKLNLDDKVLFVGRHEGEELLAWYRIGTVFVLPSRHEAFGAVVNEALISGVPAVVSNNVGARSLIEEGVNGSIVDTTKPHELSKTLLLWLRKKGKMKIVNQTGDSLMALCFSDIKKGLHHFFRNIRTVKR